MRQIGVNNFTGVAVISPLRDLLGS